VNAVFFSLQRLSVWLLNGFVEAVRFEFMFAAMRFEIRQNLITSDVSAKKPGKALVSF